MSMDSWCRGVVPVVKKEQLAQEYIASIAGKSKFCQIVLNVNEVAEQTSSGHVIEKRESRSASAPPTPSTSLVGIPERKARRRIQLPNPLHSIGTTTVPKARNISLSFTNNTQEPSVLQRKAITPPPNLTSPIRHKGSSSARKEENLREKVKTTLGMIN